jgi:hypothetical protein
MATDTKDADGIEGVFPIEICKEVTKTLRRRKAFGALESEVDFIMGASAALHALGYWPPPVNWIIAPMRGDSILEEE